MAKTRVSERIVYAYVKRTLKINRNPKNVYRVSPTKIDIFNHPPPPNFFYGFPTNVVIAYLNTNHSLQEQ